MTGWMLGTVLAHAGGTDQRPDPGGSVSARVAGQAASTDRSEGSGVVVGALGALPLRDRWMAEIEGYGGLARTSDLLAGGRLGLRVPLAGPLALRVAGGIAVLGAEIAPDAYAAVSWDLPSERPLSWRVEAGASVLEPSRAAILSIGAVFDLRRPAIPVVEAPPPPVPVGPTLTVTPEGAKVWLPHPVCAWVAVNEAQPMLADLAATGQPVMVSAPGYVPAFVTLGGDQTVDLQPAPVQGNLIVAAYAGDEVAVDGIALSPTMDGIYVIAHPEGPATVVVTGGGRQRTTEVGVASGYATWVRVERPPPVDVRFTSGSAVVSAAAAEQVAALAKYPGGWSFEVHGGASPEGDPARNQRLGQARAEAVVAVLVNAGIPQDRVRVGAPEVGTPDGDPNEQRKVWIRAVPAEVSR